MIRATPSALVIINQLADWADTPLRMVQALHMPAIFAHEVKLNRFRLILLFIHPNNIAEVYSVLKPDKKEGKLEVGERFTEHQFSEK